MFNNSLFREHTISTQKEGLLINSFHILIHLQNKNSRAQQLKKNQQLELI